jgi:N-glycosidase YbiA
MAYQYCPLPKTVDERVKQYLRAPSNEYGKPSHHGLKVAQDGNINIYDSSVYDFDDPRFLGKGCFSNRASQPVTIDGVDYPDVQTYMYVMSCEDPTEASKWLLDRGSFYNDSGALARTPEKNKDFHLVEKELLRNAVHAKLTQHIDTVNELLATGNKYMAHTSQNPLYGTGFNGKGQNLLGEIYMDARDHILSTILKNRTVHPIPNPSQEDINELASQFQDKHPDEVETMVREMVRTRYMSDFVDMAYPCGPKKFETPKVHNVNFDSKQVVDAIKSDRKFNTHKCSDRFEYLRPSQKDSHYHDRVHDSYQEILYENQKSGQRFIHNLKDYRDSNPFYGPIDFLFRGVGPVPGPAPLAVISAVICFGLMATGVGAAVIAGVAIGFAMTSGAVQGYKSAVENNLNTKQTIAATLLGAASGLLAPWPGLGPLMSALYVKAIEKGLKLGKKAVDVYFPQKDKQPDATHQTRGVEVLERQKQRGVEVFEEQKNRKVVTVLAEQNDTLTKKRLGVTVPVVQDVSQADILSPSVGSRREKQDTNKRR